MSGFKKGLFISLALVVLIIVVWFALPKLKLKNNYPDPLTALPENAILFYQGDNFRHEFDQISKTTYWKNLQTSQNINAFAKSYSLVDSAIHKNEKINSYITSQKMVLSLHKISRQQIGVLLLMQTKGKFKEDDVRKMIASELETDAKKSVFEGVSVFNYQAQSKQSTVAFAFLDGILAISSSSIIIEDAIRSYHLSTGLIDKSNFGVTFNEFKENWFVNFKQLPTLLDIFISDDLRDFAGSLSYFAQTANYELKNDEASFSLRGSIQMADTFNGFNRLFTNQKARKSDISKIASLKSAMLFSYQISDPKAFLVHYQDYMKFSKRWNAYEAALVSFEKKHQINIENDILPLLNGSFALSINEPFAEDFKQNKIVYIKVEHAAEASRILKRSESQNDDTSEQIDDFYKSHEIYVTNKADLFYLIFGSSFKLDEKAYFTSIRDYLVFSPNLHSLKQIIDDFTNGQTLNSSSDYHRFADKLVSESNFFAYINSNRTNAVLEHVLSKSWYEKNLRNSIFTKLETLGYQIVNNNNGFYNELLTTFSSSATQSMEKVWEVALDTTFSIEPWIFKNHNSGKQEVMVFDEKNNLYLISNTGEILWKRQLDNKIVGDIHQVDFYKNKKLQYLFTTETHLQLIDRLGRNTANYPIRLSAKASSGISLYQKSKTDTRIFVGTEKNHIFGFNLRGEPMSGWSPQEISGNLNFPIRYFVRSNKTQFFGVSDKGNFYRWDLKGNKINKKIYLQTKFSNPLQMRFGVDNDDSYLISIDTSGNTFFISMTDAVEVQRFGNFSQEVFFDYVDLNADKEKDLIFVDQSSFLVFSKEGEILYSLSLEAPATFHPKLLKIEDHYQLAYVNKGMNKLYMSDLNGVPERNFPVECNTPFTFFDMNGDGKLELIAGKDNKIYLSRF